MKKNYELVEVKVISLNHKDVITASVATRTEGYFGGSFDLGGLDTQSF